MAGPAGIEPVTLGLRVRCSALLSYGPTKDIKKQASSRNIELTVSHHFFAKNTSNSIENNNIYI